MHQEAFYEVEHDDDESDINMKSDKRVESVEKTEKMFESEAKNKKGE
jgi:hypothetical protein